MDSELCLCTKGGGGALLYPIGIPLAALIEVTIIMVIFTWSKTPKPGFVWKKPRIAFTQLKCEPLVCLYKLLMRPNAFQPQFSRINLVYCPVAKLLCEHWVTWGYLQGKTMSYRSRDFFTSVESALCNLGLHFKLRHGSIYHLLYIEISLWLVFSAKLHKRI